MDYKEADKAALKEGLKKAFRAPLEQEDRFADLLRRLASADEDARNEA
ncbi:hypothetical protein [Pelagovum pacificum]|nr:hypothetical protein [Pelagovum pacificum]QQA44552.1 hypothetical protein I8N54_08290 [Pelagovum pacificum]